MMYARDVIEGKLASAEKDNEFIYHMLIKENLPPPETLSRPMVKATGWEPLCEPELFADVVPDEAFISSSNYSSKKPTPFGANSRPKLVKRMTNLSSVRMH